MKRSRRSIKCKNTACPLFHQDDFVPCEINRPENEKIHVLFVGEAPGKEESNKGIPFHGKGGQLLRKSFRHATCSSNEVGYAFSNVVRCTPTDVDDKTTKASNVMEGQDIEYCKQFLHKDIEALDPEVIVLLGNAAASALINEAPNISSVRGQIHEKMIAGKMRKVAYTWHPGFVLRNGRALPLFNQDLQGAVREARGLSISEDQSKKGRYVLLDTVEKIEHFLYEELGKNTTNEDVVAIDVEAKNLNKKHNNELTMLQFAKDGEVGYCIPYQHYQCKWSQEEFERIKKALQWIFTSKDVPFKAWVAHGSRFEHSIIGEIILDGKRIRNRPMVDTLGGAYLLDENKTSLAKELKGEVYGLKALVKVHLGFNHYDAEIMDARSAGGLYKLPLNKLADYGAMDAYCTWRLFWHQVLLAKEQNYYAKWWSLLVNLFSPVYRAISRMEANGMYADLEHLRKLSDPKKSIILVRMKEIEDELKRSKYAKSANKIALKRLNEKKGPGNMKAMFGTPWVLHPNKNIDILFCEVMGLHAEKTETGKNSIGKVFYGEHRGIHEVDLVSEWKQLQKLSTAYTKQIIGFIDPEAGHSDCVDSRVHPDFRFDNTVTGRVACKSPNTQQMPKCSVAGTRVWTDEGLQAIEDLVTGVSTFRGGKITSTFSRKVQRTIRVTTERGYSVNVTEDHRMMIFSNDCRIEEKQASHLCDDDYLLVSLHADLPKTEISTTEPINKRQYAAHHKVRMDEGEYHPYTKHTQLPKTVTPELARLLGYLTAEGDVASDAGVKFSNQNPDVMEDYLATFEKCFGFRPSVRYCEKDDCLYVDMSSVRIRDFLADLGLRRTTAHSKRIPWCVMQSPRSVILHYLAGHLAGDGNIQRRFVRIHTASYEMAVDLQVLMSGLGWVASTYRDGDCWAATLHGKDAEYFADCVPVVKKLHDVTHGCVFEKEETRKVPGLKTWMKTYVQQHRTGNNQIEVEGRRIITPSMGLSNTTAKEFTFNYLQKNPEVLQGLRVIDSDKADTVKALLEGLVPVKIQKIEVQNSPVDVYEINTENHVYTANGLLSHNCEGHPARIYIKSLFQADQRLESEINPQVPDVHPWQKKGVMLNIKREMRRALVQLDFMASEVRWWAILSGDKNLAKAFNDGKAYREAYALDPTNTEKKRLAAIAGDIHKMTASLMFGVPIDKVTKEMRSATKSIVFGWMFGRSTKSIAMQIGKSVEETQELCDQFSAKFPVASRWLTWAEEFAAKNLWIESLIKRRRRLDAFMSGDDWLIAEAKRLARNSPIQSISSDGAMLGTALFCDYIEDHGLNWKVCNAVHDSSVTEVPIDEIPEMIKVAKRIYETDVMDYMTNIWDVDFPCPIEVEFEISQAPRHGWGDLVKWDFTQPMLDKILVGAKDPVQSMFIWETHVEKIIKEKPDADGAYIVSQLNPVYPNVYNENHAKQFDDLLGAA